MKQLSMSMFDGFQMSETEGVYNAFNVTEEQIIKQAQQIAFERFKGREQIQSSNAAKELIWASMQNLEQEVFACLFLDTKHHILSFEKMFYGTIDSASVYPREIAKKALELNASALIITHNHPSMDSAPSQADINLTRRVKDALALIDVRVLDHIIVGSDTYSLVENGDM